MRNKLFLLILSVFVFSYCFSQNDKTILNQTISNDTGAINALALYPVDVRNSILEACAHPDILARMGAIQEETKEQFKNLLAEYDRDDQQKIWDITRYPGLVDSLTREGKKSREQIKTILRSYPEEIHEAVLKYGRSRYSLLSEIGSLNKKTDSDFAALIKDYPRQTKTALQEIINYPEVVTILNENMRTTVLVGDIYKRNPVLVKQKLDSLNSALVQKNAQDLEDWKEGLRENPEAKKQYEESAKKYAKDQGYRDEDLIIRDVEVVMNYVTHPYPYWFGYPWWWNRPRWYPYPYWYDWGFYYGPYGMVYTGLPSWHFTNWYFSYNPHHYYYPNFSDYCVDYYYGHRGSLSGVHRGTSEWINKNEPNLPGNFFASDLERPARLKELGKFEMEYNKLNKNIPKDVFLRENAASYPNISPVLNEKPRLSDAPLIPQDQPPSQPVVIPQQQPGEYEVQPRQPVQIPKQQPREYQVQPRQQPPPVKIPKQTPLPRPVPQNTRPSIPPPQPQVVPQKAQPKKGGRGTYEENISENKSMVIENGSIEAIEAQFYHQYYWDVR